MASKHRSESPLGSVSAQRPSGSAVRWRRRLRFEPLESRHLLTTIPVTTLADENNGTGMVSLREAVGLANAGDTITFSVTGTIQLLNTVGGQITIGKSIAIQGPGSNLLTIRAFDPDAINNSNGRRVFLVDNGTSLLDVAITGVTLTNGDPTLVNEDDGGGAILNRENLTLNACVLTGNFSPNGGAIYSTDGALTVIDSTISGNSGADGAAILVSGGSLAVTRTTIANNQASNAGGGISSRNRPVTIADSTISGNSADESGGGLYQYGNSLSVTSSTISGNSADNDHDGLGAGGGIFNMTGAISVSNSTISGNSAGESGGGIFSNTNQAIAIKFSTVTGNVVANAVGVSGGGIHSANTALLDHTIVAGNLRGASTRDDVSGIFDSYYSLVGDKRDENVNNIGGSVIGTTAAPIDAKLGFLANNGGPTLTHALLSGSPALDAGDEFAVAGSGGIPQFDQRGMAFSRVVGGRIDIGAIEMAVTGPALPGDYNLNHAVDAADYVLWRKTNGTNVAAAYSGADGDGNSVVNADDYTVWRTRFGNTTPGGGSAAQGLGNGQAEVKAANAPAGGAGVTSFAFAALGSSRIASSARVAKICANQEASTGGFAAGEPLLVIGDAVGGTDNSTDDGGASTVEVTDANAARETVFESSIDELTLPLVAL